VMADKIDIADAIVKTEIPGLDLIVSSVNLSAAEVELAGVEGREFFLKNKLQQVSYYYDYILIDCPPSLGLLTINALAVSDSVLIPLQCEFYALEGLSHLLKTIERVKKNINPSISIRGIVLTMHDKRNNLTEQVEMDVRGYLGDSVFKTVIPRNIRISEAPSHGKPVILYDHKCLGSMAYLHLAREMLQRDSVKVAA